MESFVKALTLVAIFFFFASSVRAEPSIVGHWFYYKKVYQGQEMPEGPSATLRLHFEFSKEGESLLYWWHEGDVDHCTRKGSYRVEDNHLVDVVTWVDPKNSAECSYDSDMQMGKATKTPIFFVGEDLAIRFNIGDDPLDYIWRKIEGK